MPTQDEINRSHLRLHQIPTKSPQRTTLHILIHYWNTLIFSLTLIYLVLQLFFIFVMQFTLNWQLNRAIKLFFIFFFLSRFISSSLFTTFYTRWQIFFLFLCTCNLHLNSNIQFIRHRLCWRRNFLYFITFFLLLPGCEIRNMISWSFFFCVSYTFDRYQ